MSNNMNKFARATRQAGFSLIEIIVVLAIGALIVAGALSLYSSASSSQSSSQLYSDLSAIRASVKTLYSTQGGYGTASLNSILINAKKVPTTMSVSGTTINHALNGTVTVTGATGNFTMTVTEIPTDVCIGLLSAASVFTSIQVGTNSARTSFPISPTNASSDCSAATIQTIIFTAN